jgi:hypothetical protein
MIRWCCCWSGNRLLLCRSAGQHHVVQYACIHACMHSCMHACMALLLLLCMHAAAAANVATSISIIWPCPLTDMLAQVLLDKPIGVTLAPDPLTGHVYVQTVHAGTAAAESRLVLVCACMRYMTHTSAASSQLTTSLARQQQSVWPMLHAVLCAVLCATHHHCMLCAPAGW